MAMTYRTADVVYSIYNETILSVNNLSSSSTYTIPPSDLLFVYDKAFNDQTNQTMQNLNFSSTVLMDYLNSFLNMAYPFSYAYPGLNYLRAFMTIPLIQFQPNAGSDPSVNIEDPSVIGINLPASLYTTAIFGRSVSHITIDKWTVITFSCLVVSVYIWCLLYLVCTNSQLHHSRSSFALIEFAIGIINGSESAYRLLREAAASGDWQKFLLSKKLYLNGFSEEFSTEVNSVERNGVERASMSRTSKSQAERDSFLLVAHD